MTSVNAQTKESAIALVVLLARTPIAAADVERARSYDFSHFDWNTFLSRASEWQVEPVVLMNLASLGDERIPQEISEVITARAKEVRATALSRTLVANDLVSRLEQAGVMSIVLKGSGTGTTAYGDPSLRIFSDVDLLMRRSDLLAARSLLLDLGYTANYSVGDEEGLVAAGHALEFLGRSLKVELHWSLFSNYLRLPFQLDDVWSRALTVMCANRPVHVLDIQTEFVFLCAHAAKHNWSSLRWICDIAQLISRLSGSDAEGIVEISSRVNAMKLVSLGLQLCHEIFALELPPELDRVRRRIDTRSITKRVRADIGLSGNAAPSSRWSERFHPAFPQLLFWIRARERMSDRIGSVTDLAFGRRARPDTD